MLARCTASLARTLPRSLASTSASASAPQNLPHQRTAAMLLRTAATAAAVPGQTPAASRRAAGSCAAPATAAPSAATALRARGAALLAAPQLRRGIFTRTGATGKDEQPAATAATGAGSSGGGAGTEAQQQSQQQQTAMAPAMGGRGGELDMLSGTLLPSPFRRMADHMMQMQREMDDMLCTFAAPLLGPSAALSPTDPFMLDLFAEPTAAALPLQPLSRRGGGAPALAATAGGGGLAARLLGGGRLVPVMEVEERESEYVVTAEVPGFDKNEIKVSLSEDGVLTMTGTHAESSETAPTQPQPSAASGSEAPVAEQQQTVPTPQGIPGTSKRPSGAPTTGSSTGSSSSYSRYSSFVRALRLPVGGVEPEGIKAATQHGVLTVTIPKKAQPVPKVREIPVA